MLGSRDYTVRGGLGSQNPSATKTTQTVKKNTDGGGSEGKNAQTSNNSREVRENGKYIPEEWFVCRARVVGVETEPMRVMEKTKRRQRHVKTVRSKMRFTILRIVEVKVKVPGEGEGEWEVEA